MTVKQIYDLAVKEGINADPRGKAKVQKELLRTKKLYKDLNKQQAKEFDKESLTNPYGDTRILFGNPDQKVKKVLVGVDIEVGELVLADRLNQKGKKIDLVMAHHPEGRALAGLSEVMAIQIEILRGLGVPINIAEALMIERIAEVKRKLSPANHTRAVDAARLLGLAFMCCHTVADNHVVTYLQSLLAKKKPETLGDIVEILKDIPEYRYATEEKAGPRIIVGNPRRQAGKIFVDMTGGTEGSKDVFQKLAQAGIGTILAMHLSEDHFRKVKAEHINVIIAGHIASDNVGINLLLDKLEKTQKLDIVECSGFKRIKRK